MIKTLRTKTFSVLLLLALPIVGATQQRAAFGPIERSDGAGRIVTVLGQPFSITDATRFAIDGRLLASADPQLLTQYTSAYIEGISSGSEVTASLINLSRASYVAGATVVFVEGPIAEVSYTLGVVRIGSVWVDISAVSPDVVSAIAVGSSVQISGVQPVSKGRLVGPVLLNSIDGTSTARISQASIGGSGRQVSSIGGSGRQVSSIGGSGSLNLSTTVAEKSSIGGSGSQVSSIGGSGSSLQSIGGSGSQIRISSIGGSGRATASIGGSGTL
jgi:hypothetical protein